MNDDEYVEEYPTGPDAVPPQAEGNEADAQREDRGERNNLRPPRVVAFPDPGADQRHGPTANRPEGTHTRSGRRVYNLNV